LAETKENGELEEGDEEDNGIYLCCKEVRDEQ